MDYHTLLFEKYQLKRPVMQQCNNDGLHDRRLEPERPHPGRLECEPSGTTPTPKRRGEVHQWFFVREIHKG
jgi:hypothetical protein